MLHCITDRQHVDLSANSSGYEMSSVIFCSMFKLGHLLVSDTTSTNANLSSSSFWRRENAFLDLQKRSDLGLRKNTLQFRGIEYNGQGSTTTDRKQRQLAEKVEPICFYSPQSQNHQDVIMRRFSNS